MFFLCQRYMIFPWSHYPHLGYIISPFILFSNFLNHYIPSADCRPQATGGFTQRVERKLLEVDCPGGLLERVAEDRRAALLGVLANDPRPSYQNDPERVYGMEFAGVEVRFQVAGERLRVCEISQKGETP